MRVIFFITSSAQAKGGHYYSLLETANALLEQCNVLIISVGLKKSPVLENFVGKYVHVKEEGLFKTFRAVRKILKNENADIYHAFDSRVFFYVRFLSFLNGIPNVLTKCGGGNARHYPVCDNLVVYSLENLEFYKSHTSFSKTNIAFLPNRISVPEQDRQRIKQLEAEIIKDLPVILRIARISEGYERSILQAIELVESLNKNSLTAQLLVIGTVQNEVVYKKLKAHESKYVKFFTKNKYNLNASQLIDIADVVVGTGRGFMEAACLGKIMLASTENTDVPVLVSKNNFFDIFKYNFSQRFVSKLSTLQALDEIVSCMKSQNPDENIEFISAMANEYFMVEKVLYKYMHIYRQAKKPTLHPLDTMKQCVIKLRKA